MKPFFFYILECEDNSFYVGHADDIEGRLNQHISGLGSGYTSTRLPVKLIFLREFETREEALALEFKIKRWLRKKTMALVEGDWNQLMTLAKKVFK